MSRNDNPCMTKDDLISLVDINYSNSIVFYNEKFKEKDFKELRRMVDERRGEMYILFNFYFVCPKTLTCDCQLAIGKKEATALTKAHKASMFADVDLDLLEIHTEKIMEFEKKKDLKKAVETIKDALG